MKTHTTAAFLGCFLCTAHAPAADLKLLPAETTLTGPHATQQLLLVTEESGKAIGDLTNRVKFSSSNPACGGG